MHARVLPLALLSLLVLVSGAGAQQVSGQDLDTILQKADALLEEAKTGYESARSQTSPEPFVTAGFKLEEARIKYLVLQEVGSPEKQKIAVDRLRAVNQLGKLLHEAKLVLSKPSTEQPAAAPTAGETPAKAPVEAPTARIVRVAVPEAARQREAEALVRDLYKAQYAKTSPADRQALARSLLEHAARTTDDPVSQWVLFREAQEVALLAGDVRTALASVESAARLFDVDPILLKSGALASATKSAKTPAECSALAEALLKLAEEYVAVDQYDQADASASAALQQARRANDAALIARATTRSREVTEAKALYRGMKGVLEILARRPEDPRANIEMGQFLCFVKGNWDLGLRFLAKGSEAVLKPLAEKEIAFPEKAADQVAIADGWWDLAQKEKSPLRKGQMLAHAAALYQGALGTSTGLLTNKIQKRLADLGPALPAAPTTPAAASTTEINLLPLIDPKKDGVSGDWSVDGGKLVCGTSAMHSRIQIPYAPPDEYDVTAVVVRTENLESVNFGLVRGATQFQAVVDAWGGGVSGLSMLDGKLAVDNETVFRKSLLKNNEPGTIVCSVRKDGFKMTVDGLTVVDWKGNYGRLSNDGGWSVPHSNALYFGCYSCKVTVIRLVLTPVSGRGKKLRS